MFTNITDAWRWGLVRIKHSLLPLCASVAILIIGAVLLQLTVESLKNSDMIAIALVLDFIVSTVLIAWWFCAIYSLLVDDTQWGGLAQFDLAKLWAMAVATLVTTMALLGLILVWPLCLLVVLLISIATGSNPEGQDYAPLLFIAAAMPLTIHWLIDLVRLRNQAGLISRFVGVFFIAIYLFIVFVTTGEQLELVVVELMIAIALMVYYCITVYQSLAYVKFLAYFRNAGAGESIAESIQMTRPVRTPLAIQAAIVAVVVGIGTAITLVTQYDLSAIVRDPNIIGTIIRSLDPGGSRSEVNIDNVFSGLWVSNLVTLLLLLWLNATHLYYWMQSTSDVTEAA